MTSEEIKERFDFKLEESIRKNEKKYQYRNEIDQSISSNKKGGDKEWI
jgi:hypothetical protein